MRYELTAPTSLSTIVKANILTYVDGSMASPCVAEFEETAVNRP